MVSTPHGADSEVGRLTTVMLHRPGNELKRLTPRNNDRLLFDGIPWVSRAQEEHDAFAETLRDRGVEVLYLTDLLTETLGSELARNHAITSALSGLHLGDTMRRYLAQGLRDLTPAELTDVLTAGIRNDEVKGGHGLVTSLLDPHDFLVDPLPNLLFTRDSSVWVRDRVAVTSLAMPARKRETQLTELIYTEHPRFAGTRKIHVEVLEHWEEDLERRADIDEDDWRLIVVIGSGIYKDPLRTLRRVHRVLLARGMPGVPLRLSDDWRPHFPGFSDAA